MNTHFNLDTPETVIAAVPHLIGFHPKPPTLVIIGRKDNKITIACSLDLDTGEEAISVPEGIIDASASVLLIGYGLREVTEPVALAVAFLVGLDNVTVDLALIVHEGRYWDLSADSPGDGIAIPAGPSVFDTVAVAGGVQTFPSREAISALFAPAADANDPAMSAALAAAQDEVKANPDALDRLAAEGIQLLHKAVHDTDLPGVDVTARLTVALTLPVVRDAAMTVVDSGPRRACEDLWIHLVRHAPPDLRTAPAVLAAYSAWRGGAGHIAVAALAAIDDEHRDDPIAEQLQRLMDDAVHPTTVPAYEPGQPLTRTRRSSGDVPKG